MRAEFHNIAVTRHGDAIGIADSGEPMCDHQGGAPLAEAPKRRLDASLCTDIDGGRRLVEDYDRRVCVIGARQAGHCHWLSLMPSGSTRVRYLKQGLKHVAHAQVAGGRDQFVIVRQNLARGATTLVEFLFHRLEGEETPSATLPVRIINRNSV